jgi:hypothetical protein
VKNGVYSKEYPIDMGAFSSPCNALRSGADTLKRAADHRRSLSRRPADNVLGLPKFSRPQLLSVLAVPGLTGIVIDVVRSGIQLAIDKGKKKTVSPSNSDHPLSAIPEIPVFLIPVIDGDSTESDADLSTKCESTPPIDVDSSTSNKSTVCAPLSATAMQRNPPWDVQTEAESCRPNISRSRKRRERRKKQQTS